MDVGIHFRTPHSSRQYFLREMRKRTRRYKQVVRHRKILQTEAAGLQFMFGKIHVVCRAQHTKVQATLNLEQRSMYISMHVDLSAKIQETRKPSSWIRVR